MNESVADSAFQQANDEAAGEKLSSHIAVRVSAYYNALIEAKVPDELARILVSNFANTYTLYMVGLMSQVKRD